MEPISIVVPAFNEEGGIVDLLSSIHSLHIPCEVVVVDDASTDQTAELAHRHGAKVVKHPLNCGYGKSVKDGVLHASHDTIVVTDADGTYPVDRIPELLVEYRRGCDMVVGARQGKAYRGTFLKMPARYVFKMLVEFTTGRKIPDINSGLRVFSKKKVLPYFPDICNGFSFTTTITLIYMLTGKTVSYLPIPYAKRVGRSKVKIIRDSLRTLQYITECIVRYNPLKFFLLLSGITFFFACVGAFLATWILFVGLFASLTIFALGCLAESMRHSRE